MDTFFWNLDSGVVSWQRYNSQAATVARRRGGDAVQVVLTQTVDGVPNTPVQLATNVPVGIVVRNPQNLKTGPLAGATVLTRGTAATDGYSGTTSTDTTFTRALMHVDPADAASELPTFPGSAVFYYVPAGGDEIESLPFAWTILPNYYRPLQPPATAGANYPPPDQIIALLTPYQITATTGTVTLPAGTVNAITATVLTGPLTLVVPDGNLYPKGARLTISTLPGYTSPAHTVSVIAADNGDTVNGLDTGDSPIVIFNTDGLQHATLVSEGGGDWVIEPNASGGVNGRTGAVTITATNATGTATKTLNLVISQ